MKTKKIKLLKESDAGEIGDVITTTINTAEEFVKRGYAEYITTPLKEVARQYHNQGNNIVVLNNKKEPLVNFNKINLVAQRMLVRRLVEANLSVKRFLKVDRHKKAFEKGWQNKLYGPEDLSKYPRWGIVGKDGLVLIDVDNEQMENIMRSHLPHTFETISPRRKLPHFYLKVINGVVENKTLHLPNEKEGAGEIRAQNEYLVAPGTVITYNDLETGEEKTGEYYILNDRPIATMEYKTFMEVITPFLGSDASQPITHEQMREGVPEGTRHAQGMKFASFLVKVQKFDFETALHEMISWNQKCKPPMNENDLERMVKNAIGYPDRGKLQGTKIGSYRLKKRGKKAFLFNDADEIVFSCNLDSVDGLQTKKKIREIVGLDEAEVNRATAAFMFTLQSIKRGAKVEEKEKPTEDFNEETENKARTLLCDPAFFYKLGCVFKRGFIVSKLNKPRFVIGEKRNKRLVGPLLIGASKLNMTSLTKLLGDPATAKDTMLRMWLDLLPIKSVERSFFTAAGLRYSQQMKDADLLYIPDSPELHGEMGRQMRFMRADDGGLISEYASRDGETGEMVTKISKLPVKAIATTSNALTGDTALESGMWTLRTNATEELTKKVKIEKLKLRAGKRELFPEDELKVWRCAFKILVSEELPDALPNVPFAEELLALLESGRSESRRDPDKLCDLISLIAWVRRFQKPLDERGESDLVDLYSALQIGLDAISQTISELDEKEERIFKAVKEGTAEELKVSVTVRDVTEKTKIPYETCYRYLERLVQKGFLNQDKEKGKNIYSVLGENTPKQAFVSEVKSSEDPTKLMEFVLESIKDSSTLHKGSSISLIDPVTGKEVKVNMNENNELVSTAENKLYEYPYEELKTSKRSEETLSKEEKKPKEVVIWETKRENGKKPTVQEIVEYAYSQMEKRKPDNTTGDMFIHDLVVKGLSKEEAEKKLEKLLDEGVLAYDPDGWLVKI